MKTKVGILVNRSRRRGIAGEHRCGRTVQRSYGWMLNAVVGVILPDDRSSKLQNYVVRHARNRVCPIGANARKVLRRPSWTPLWSPLRLILRSPTRTSSPPPPPDTTTSTVRLPRIPRAIFSI